MLLYNTESNPGESTRLKVNKVDYDDDDDDSDTYSLQSSDDEDEMVSYEDCSHTMHELECWSAIINTRALSSTYPTRALRYNASIDNTWCVSLTTFTYKYNVPRFPDLAIFVSTMTPDNDDRTDYLPLVHAWR